VTPELAGRVAVITGASRGLGAGLAVHFAAAGLQLGLCARHRPSVVVATGPTARDGQVISAELPLCAAVDVTDHTGLDHFAGAVIDRFGRIDLWVNNAGLLAPIGPLVDSDPALVARNIEVNVMGVINGSSLFARHVRTRPGRGVLINLSSGAGTRPYAGWGPYCAAKAAVDQVTRVIALEESRYGLAAYSVAPGIVNTEMQEMIRSSSPEAFPEVERFRRIAADGNFNSPTWVAGQLLDIAFGRARPNQVTVRIADEPRSGRAQ
jgi:NAD(P)-dependent dehydrogenase (short-subunit alcohol dehydrogenase family)